MLVCLASWIKWLINDILYLPSIIHYNHVHYNQIIHVVDKAGDPATAVILLTRVQCYDSVANQRMAFVIER